MKIAIIDMGSNSIRLLLGYKNEKGWMNEGKQLWTTRLGVRNEQGELTETSMEASYEALKEIKQLCQAYGAEKIVALATSAVREAPNGTAFLQEANTIMAMDSYILTGEEEAELGFLGATSDWIDDGLHYTIIDIGGGSTELALGSKEGIYWKRSYQMGAVRYQSLSEEGPQRIWQEAQGWWDPMPIAGPFGEFIGIGGTITTLAAIDLKLTEYDRSKIQGQVLTREKVEGIVMMLRYMSRDERLQVPGLPAGRADIIVAGAEILTAFMDTYEVPRIIVSDKDAMEGYEEYKLG